MFSRITNLKLKPSEAWEHSLPPPLPKLDWEGSPVIYSTKLGNFSTMGSFHLSFGSTILLGSACFVGGIITTHLISWYVNVNKSQNTEVLIKYPSSANQLLRGNGIRDKVDYTISDAVCNRKRDLAGDEMRGEVFWENLPQEMWGEIGKRMVSRLDIMCFRCVCKKWRSSLPSPTSTARFPLLLPPPPTCDPEFRNMPYTISEVTIYHSKIGTALMQVDEGGIFWTSSELSRLGDKKDFDMASRSAFPCRLRTRGSVSKEEGHRLNFRNLTYNSYSAISFFTKLYYPCAAFDSHKIRHEGQCSEFPKKLVLISSSSSSNINPNYARMSDLSVVAHLGGEGRLALLRLGGPREDWVWDTAFCSRLFVNIATYEGKLCTLDYSGNVFLMDYNSLQFTQVCAPLSVPFDLEGKSFFEACGDLYLIHFHVDSSIYGFEAYKLSLPLQKWLKVEGMAGRQFGYVAPFLL